MPTMNWIVLAIMAALCNALMDLFNKFSAGRIHASLGGAVLNVFAAISAIVYTIVCKVSGQKIFYSKEGMIFSILGGLSIGLMSTLMNKMFSSGVSVSIGSPVVRIMAVAMAVILGIVFLKETTNWKIWLGLALSVTGLYLMMTGR